MVKINMGRRYCRAGTYFLELIDRSTTSVDLTASFTVTIRTLIGRLSIDSLMNDLKSSTKVPLTGEPF